MRFREIDFCQLCLKLKRIYLDHNRFEYIQHFLFYDLAELEEINLSNNILSFVHPHAFTECENLRQLDLSSNHLKEFQSKWVKPLLDTSLIELHLDDNEWQCDCEMEDKLGFFADDQLKAEWFKRLCLVDAVYEIRACV